MDELAATGGEFEWKIENGERKMTQRPVMKNSLANALDFVTIVSAFRLSTKNQEL